MKKWTRLGLVIVVALLSAAISCVDYDLAGPGDWDPANQPDELGETFQEDVFIQRTAEASDILFVVDNSTSMYDEQQALIDNFTYFIQFLVGTALDYHIGVVTLDDPEDPPIGTLLGSPTYIDPSMAADAEAHFMQAVNSIQINPEGTCEVGLEASYRAVTPSPEGHSDTYNTDFYREDALLSVVIVSDEDDGSLQTADCPTPEAFIGHAEYGPWFTSFKGSHTTDLVYFAAIVGDAQTGCSSGWGSAEPGLGYLDVVDYLGPNHSTFFSICEHDWSEVMIEIGLAAAGMRTAFNLSHVPLEGTLEVYLDVDGDGPESEVQIHEDPTYQQSYAFVYDRVSNSLLFTVDTMPPETAELRVVYQLAQDA